MKVKENDWCAILKIAYIQLVEHFVLEKEDLDSGYTRPMSYCLHTFKNNQQYSQACWGSLKPPTQVEVCWKAAEPPNFIH